MITGTAQVVVQTTITFDTEAEHMAFGRWVADHFQQDGGLDVAPAVVRDFLNASEDGYAKARELMNGTVPDVTTWEDTPRTKGKGNRAEAVSG